LSDRFDGFVNGFDRAESHAAVKPQRLLVIGGHLQNNAADARSAEAGQRLQKQTASPLFLDQPMADGNLNLGDTIASGEDLFKEVEWQEIGRFLKEAIGKLPQAYGLLLVLRHQEGMSYQEIADETGVPLGTVKTHLFRARAALRRELAVYYGWEV